MCQTLAKHIPIENELAPIFVFLWRGNRGLYNFFNFPSIATAEMHRLSYILLNDTTGRWALLLLCSVIPIENALGVKNRGRGECTLTPNEPDLSFCVLNYGAKFHQNWVRTATVGEVTDRQTDRHTDAGDIIICPMLCYSNGTDKKIWISNNWLCWSCNLQRLYLLVNQFDQDQSRTLQFCAISNTLYQFFHHFCITHHSQTYNKQQLTRLTVSQCSTVVRNTVVRATIKVNGKHPILGTRRRQTLWPIDFKFGVGDYVGSTTQHAKKLWKSPA